LQIVKLVEFDQFKVKKRKERAVMAKGKYEKWLEPDNILLLQAWARDGLTDEQIAHNMGIRRATLYVWKKKYPYISDALKRGKDVVDVEVENALLKRALGYDYNEITEIRENGVVTQRKIVKKHMAPDVTAQIFWAKNRKPDIWRDLKKIDSDIKVTNPFEGVSTEDIRKLINSE
jgi:hypothetical protein